MSSARRWAALLLLTGLAAGTMLDVVPARTPIRVEDEWMLSADFHVHAFPGDGSLPPWSVRREAEYAGIDVIALTNHNQTFTARFGQWLASFSSGPIVIAGSEITNPAFHLIAVGIEHPVEWNQHAADAIASVHAQGGVAIAAHPSRRFWDGWDDRARSRLDGVEVAHPNRNVEVEAARAFDAFYEGARKQHSNLAVIGSSDFHGSPSLGQCRTYLFARERTAAAVLDAIRSARTVAEDGEGQLYGPPELVRLVAAHRPRGRADERPALRGLTVACAWTGLAGLLLLRHRRSGSRHRSSGV